jgi:hypothetical protein
MVLLEKVRWGAEVWGHTTTPRDYRVLMNDRGPKAMRRTLDKLGLSTEAKARIIRLTSAQQFRFRDALFYSQPRHLEQRAGPP